MTLPQTENIAETGLCAVCSRPKTVLHVPSGSDATTQRRTFWWEHGEDVSEVPENEVILVIGFFSVPRLGASFCMYC